MPAKSKGTHSEWSECLSCSKIIHYKDTRAHQSECREGFKPTHAFIEGNCLHATFIKLVDIQDHGIDFSILHKEDVVFLHPNTMKICSLHIGKPCIVNGSDVKVAWPCIKVPPTSVGLLESANKQNDVCLSNEVIIESFIGSPHIASKVILLSRTEGQNDEKFIQHLKTKLVGKYLSETSHLPIRYFGQRKEFTVSSIETSNSTELKCVISNVGDIDDLSCSIDSLKMSQLDISSSSGSFLEESFKEETADVNPDSSDNLTSTPQKEDASFKLGNFRTPVTARTKDDSNRNKKFYFITDKTAVIIQNKQECSSEARVNVQNSVTFGCVGGLATQIKLLKDLIAMPLQSPETFSSYGLSIPKGILLFGPPGTGKSLLTEAICNEVSTHVIRVPNSEIWSKFYGETETRLRNVFKEADSRAPSIIIMDDIDSLCPRRDSTPNELEKRVVTTMLSLMDNIDNLSNNIDFGDGNRNSQRRSLEQRTGICSTTCSLDKIDPALRRPGRFEKEIEIGVPITADRKDILQKLLVKLNHDLTEEEITEIAEITHGFVGADLDALIKEALLEVFKRGVHAPSQSVLHRADLCSALTIIKPTAMREVQLEVPKVLWSDIGGQDEIKLKLKQAVEWPLKHPEAFVRMGIKPPKGILLYGPPGCSKTMVAKALATESGLNFIAVKGPELFNKWVGESERAVREVFRKARAAAPSIIFFDEIDALAVERGSSSGSSNVADRVLTQLLTEIDGIEILQDVTIVAATNRPDMIDKALMRPGRIDRILYVPLPDSKTRREIFQIKFSTMPVDSEVDAKELVQKTIDYSGAEIAAVCHEAAMYSLQEDISNQCISCRHFEKALLTVTPRTNQKMKEFYTNYSQHSGLHSI